MTDLDQNNGMPNAPADGGKKPAPTVDLSAPYRGVDMTSGRKRSSALPVVLFLLAGTAGGYFFGGNIVDMLPKDSTSVPVAESETPQDLAPPVSDMAGPAASMTDPAASVADPAASMAGADPAPLPGDIAPPADLTVADGAIPAAPEATMPPPDGTVLTAPDGTASAVPAVSPVTDAALAAPPDDLPMPQNANDGSQPAAPATDTAQADDAGKTAPTAAEMAIVQNGAVMDQLSQPNGAQIVAQAMPDAVPALPSGQVQDAIVRPLPKQYLIVKKNHDAEDIDSRLTSARQALVQHRNSAALELFNELYKDYPRDRRVLMGRAVALQKLNDYGGALAAYEEVLNVEPQNLEALTNMLGLLKAQDPALAVQKLGELQEAYPYNADIAAQLAVAHAGQGSYQEAQRYLDLADALKPGSASVLYNRAVLYDKMGRRTEAADLYRRIVRMSTEGKLDQSLPIEAIKSRLATMR